VTSPLQRHLQRTTNKEEDASAISRIQTRDPNNQAAADLRLSRTAIGISSKYNYNEQIKEKETLRAACREEINLHNTSIEKLKDRDHTEDVPRGQKYQIKSTLIKQSVRRLAGFNWLWIGSMVGLF